MRVTDLLDDHTALDQALTRVRRAVFDRRLDDARALWAWLVPLLEAHLAFEEAALLPLYESLGDFAASAHPRTFRRDHRLIGDAVAEVDLDGDRVVLCDALAVLAGRLEHHDLREARHFKPRLDDEVDANVLGPHLARWNETRRGFGERPAPQGEREPMLVPPLPDAPLEAVRTALAWGDETGALAELTRLQPSSPKARRHATTALRALEHGEPAVCWDRLRLVQHIHAARTSGR